MHFFSSLTVDLTPRIVVAMNIRLRAALVVVFIAGACVTMYQYTTPTAIGAEAVEDVPVIGRPAQSLVGSLPGDLGLYVVRFFLSLVLLGVVPFIAAKSAGIRPGELGLKLPTWRGSGRLFVLLVAVGFAVGIGGAFDPALSGIYPFSRTLVGEIAAGGWWLYPVHFFAYLALYYLPWEFLFRGLLVALPVGVFRQFAEKGDTRPVPVEALLIVASVQIVPSAILHVGHPFTETLGAVLFGIVAAYFAIKTGSILPGLILHGVIGLTLDTVVIIQAVAAGGLMHNA